MTTDKRTAASAGRKIDLNDDFTLYDLRNKEYQIDGELNIEGIVHDMQRIMI